MNEIWKPVVGYEGLYEVSNLGNVRSVDHIVNVVRGEQRYQMPIKGQPLAPQPRQHGYLAVPLYGKGGHKTRNMRIFSVHRLVAQAFIPNPDNLPEVNHMDEDKTNNRADNLEWCDRKYNSNYGTCIERRCRITRNNERSRPISQYTISGELVKTYPSCHEAERQTGFSIGNIHHAANKKANGYAYGYIWKFA